LKWFYINGNKIKVAQRIKSTSDEKANIATVKQQKGKACLLPMHKRGSVSSCRGKWCKAVVPNLWAMAHWWAIEGF